MSALHEISPTTELARVQELFHGLIRARAREGGISIPRRLPKLEGATGTASEPSWFPISGMYGGFAYWLEWKEGEPRLHTQSWCRVVAGSGQYHLITCNQQRGQVYNRSIALLIWPNPLLQLTR